MSINTSYLRGAIYRSYSSQNAFIADLGWPKNKLGDILKGARIPDIADCEKMSSKLHLSQDEFWDIFLPTLSPFRDKVG